MGIYLSDEQGRLKKVADDLPIVTRGIDTQLNSESTNPVQNKVLYEPVSFAESERHKGKNLFDFDRILYNGKAFDKKQQIVKVHTNNYMTTTTENWLVEFADLEIGGTYHLHFETTSSEADYITFNGSLKRVDNDTTFTVTKEDLLGTVSFYTVKKTTSTVSEIIIEAGDKFTGYCPYYGKLLREGDKVSRYLKQQYLECNKNLFYTDSKRMSFTKTSYTDWFDTFDSTWLGSAEGYHSISLKNNREDNSILTVDTRGVDYGTYNAYEFRTGDLGANFSIKMYELDPDTEYTLSFYTDWVHNDITFFDIECSSVENTDFKSITFTTSSEGSYEFVNGFVCDAPNTLVMIRDIILEKGPVFTGYTYPVGRPLYALDLERYNNTITTSLENKVDKEDGKDLSTNDYTDDDKNKLDTINIDANIFAESERQKSKNLLVYPYTGEVYQYGVTFTDNGDGSFTINGKQTDTTANSYHYMETNDTFKLSAGTYTLKAFADTSITGWNVVLYDGTTYHDVSSSNITKTITFSEDKYCNVYIQVSKTSTTTFNNFVVKPILVKGNDVGDWQPYSGAIVREKQLKEAVDKRELFYDVLNNRIDITNSTLDTLQQYFDLFKSDTSKIYTCNMGAFETSKFKDLLPDIDLGNYCACYIKHYSNGLWENGRLEAFEIVAFEQFGQHFAKGYLYKNLNDKIVFTGWTK